MTAPNGYTTIDRRPKLTCDCGCGQEATLPHFTKDDGRLVLPGCVPAHQERRTSQRLLREVVTKQGGFWSRVMRSRQVYRLQRSIFDRQGASAARRTALRSATVYVFGTRAGLLMSLVWRKA